MKRCPNNQINTSFIDISRIKWLVFFIAVVFLPHNQYRCTLRITGRLLARTRSNRQHSGETSKTMERQRNRSWIRDQAKIHKRGNSFIDGSVFCPGALKHVPPDSEKHLHVYTSSHVCHSHEWRVDTATGKTLKKQNAC